MGVNTLGEAYRLGWRVRVRCIWSAPGRKSSPGRVQIQCDTTTELDMKTLVWTRGEMMALELLAERLRCPKCGNLKIQVWFEMPGQPGKTAVRAAE